VQWQVRLPPQSARSGEEKHEKAQGKLSEKLKEGEKEVCKRALETKHTQNVEWFSLQEGVVVVVVVFKVKNYCKRK